MSSIAVGSATQSNVYDASGDLLIQGDSTTGSTLFLGATQLHIAAGSSTTTAVRTYTADGVPVAERSTAAGVSGSVLTWLGADTQGTVDLQMNAATGTFGVRLQDPFGQARGSSTTTWSDGHGFLNATTDPLSGLTQVGAREYDASIGRFLSVDSVLSPTRPQQNNGYSYAQNSPIDLSDPSGLDPADYWSSNPSPPTHAYLPPGIAWKPAAPGNNSASKKTSSSAATFARLRAAMASQYDGYGLTPQCGDCMPNPYAGEKPHLMDALLAAETVLIVGVSIVEIAPTLGLDAPLVAAQDGGLFSLEATELPADAEQDAEIAASEAAATSPSPALFRVDTRDESEIFSTGFASKGSNMDLSAHAYDNSDDSGFIATSKTPTGALTGAQTSGPANLYIMKGQPTGIDVNDYFGPGYPFPEENEIAVPVFIGPEDIWGAQTADGRLIMNPNYVP